MQSHLFFLWQLRSFGVCVRRCCIYFNHTVVGQCFLLCCCVSGVKPEVGLKTVVEKGTSQLVPTGIGLFSCLYCIFITITNII